MPHDKCPVCSERIAELEKQLDIARGVIRKVYGVIGLPDELATARFQAAWSESLAFLATYPGKPFIIQG